MSDDRQAVGPDGDRPTGVAWSSTVVDTGGEEKKID
jgi:hypothetical protein